MKKVLVLAAGLLLIGANLYAGNGDLIVNGNLGVGTGTPGASLHIQGTTGIRLKYSSSAISEGNIVPAGDSGGLIYKTDSGLSTSAVAHTFQTYNSGYDTRLAILGNGNVGIGTTAPSERLHVLTGTAYVPTSSLFGGGGSVINQGGEPAYVLSQDIGSAGTQTGAEMALGGMGFIYMTSSDFNNLRVGTQSNHHLIFRTNNTDKMIITNDGNVGIGTTSLDPTYRLTINGKGLASDGIWQDSDIKLKKNILPVEGALDKVLKLNGVSYEWKHGKDFEGETVEALQIDEDGNIKDDKYRDLPEGRTLGVVAQELENVLPEAVNTGDDGIKAVSYTKIIPVLIEAVKEQQKQIADQQKRIEELEKKVSQLK